MTTLNKEKMKSNDDMFKSIPKNDFILPKYSPTTHYIELTKSKYFKALLTLRHYIKRTSDYYWGDTCDSTNVDLFMLTPSISSPMGPGSNSEAIPIKFGETDSYLVDSSQFGFEPLLMNDFDKVYCYLPSMRGEDPNKRHLNQFYHCEAEIKGDIQKLIPLAEGYVKNLGDCLLNLPIILEKLSLDFDKSKEYLENIKNVKNFPQISFDDAIKELEKKDKHLVNHTEFGRDITSEGELRLAEILGFKTPFWIRNYDRDRVAFYQKPNPEDDNTVINGDLIFPPINKSSFGGEIMGAGQRQNLAEELYESLKRQNIDSKPYEWYINLRKLPGYEITSGFGLGIERFITWALGRDDIKDSIPYPRLKNVLTYP